MRRLLASCSVAAVVWVAAGCDGDPPGACMSASDCGSGLWCVDGRCSPVSDTGPLPDGASCPPGTVGCSGGCVDIQSDPTSCGTCGNACAVGQECVTGLCAPACGPSEVRCGLDCVLTEDDPSHCGACGAACEAGQACAAGGCCDPGRPPIEICNGADDDCDGTVDLPSCDPSLVAWYRFERSDSAVLDSSGGGNHGTPTAGVMRGVPGRIGTGVFFDGALTSYIEAPSSPSLFFASAFTAEAWIRPADCAHATSGHNTIAVIEGEFLFAFDNSCQSASYVHNGATWQGDFPMVTVTTDAWQHYAYTWDGATVRSYLDGDPLSAGGTPFGATMVETGNRLFLGSRVDCCDQTFHGSMDEVRLYDEARTREQICADAGGEVVDDDCVIP